MALSEGVVLGLTAALFWGVNDFLAKGALAKGGLVGTVLWINLIGTCLALPMVLLLPPESLEPTALLVLAACGISAVAAQLLFYRAFQLGRISIVSPISSIYPAVTVILALALLQENPGPWRIVGTALALGGTAMVARAPDPEVSEDKRWSLGAREAFAAMGVLGLLLFLVKVANEWGTGPALPLMTVRATSAVAFGLMALAGGALRPPPRENVKAIGAMGVLDSSAFLVYSLGVAGGLVSVVSPLSALYAAITVLLAWTLLGERYQRHQLVALGPLFVGVVLISL